MSRFTVLAALAFAFTSGCETRGATPAHSAGAAAPLHTPSASNDTTPGKTASPATPRRSAADSARAPNELGRIPILEYHLIADTDGRWERSHDRFLNDLKILYERGYRPVTISQILDRKLNLPRGLSPVVFVFDDASPSQFKYIERNGKLEIDPGSAVGLWLAFRKTHPDWTNSAVFCMLPNAEAGRSFFGNKGIEGQKTEWRFQKVKFLADSGFELCNHTLWHANLGKYPDPFVQEQIARGQMAIDSAVPDYKVRTFALPLGVWPKNRPLAWEGSWTDPRSKKTVTYKYDAVLNVSGGPTRSPYDPAFDPRNMTRVEVFAEQLEPMLDRLDRSGNRYVSDGDAAKIAHPPSSPR
ncbi:MAG TPA: polysaccharide deacetylase family protein [Gemmatimonadaceae bacterium]